MYDVMVVGSLNMDLVIRTPHLPQPGETIIGRDFTTAPGGKGANQAVAAARLGGSVAMIGRVGNDDFGRALRSNLDAAGVDTTHTATDDAAPTGVALITIEGGGQNTIVVASGANGNLVREDVDRAASAIRSSKALVAQLEVPLDTVTYTLHLARDARVSTLLNPAPAQPLSESVLRLCDMIVPNEVEAATLTGIPVNDWESAQAAAQKLGQHGVPVVVITLGARGALAWDRGAVYRIPAFPVAPVDATAAGDAFVGALAVARAQHLDLAASLRRASAAGALAVSRLGAQPSLPTAGELDAFLTRHPG